MLNCAILSRQARFSLPTLSEIIVSVRAACSTFRTVHFSPGTIIKHISNCMVQFRACNPLASPESHEGRLFKSECMDYYHSESSIYQFENYKFFQLPRSPCIYGPSPVLSHTTNPVCRTCHLLCLPSLKFLVSN